MANEQLTIQPNDARMTVIGKSWPDQASDSGGGEWDDTYNGTYSGPIPRTDLPTKIAVTTPPTKTEYKKNERIDFDGMVVTAYNEDGTVWTSTQYPDGIIPMNEIISSRSFSRDEGKKIKYKNIYNPEYPFKVMVFNGAATFSFSRAFTENTYYVVNHALWGISEYSGSVLTSIIPSDIPNSAVILFGTQQPEGGRSDSPWRFNYMLCSKTKSDIIGTQQSVSKCSRYIVNYRGKITDETASQNFSETTGLNRFISNKHYSYPNGYIYKGKPVFFYFGNSYVYPSHIFAYSYEDYSGSGFEFEVTDQSFSRYPYDLDLTSYYMYMPWVMMSSHKNLLRLAWEVLYGDDYETLDTVTIYWQRPEDGKYLSTSFDVTIKDESSTGGI